MEGSRGTSARRFGQSEKNKGLLWILFLLLIVCFSALYFCPFKFLLCTFVPSNCVKKYPVVRLCLNERQRQNGMEGIGTCKSVEARCWKKKGQCETAGRNGPERLKRLREHRSTVEDLEKVMTQPGPAAEEADYKRLILDTTADIRKAQPKIDKWIAERKEEFTKGINSILNDGLYPVVMKIAPHQLGFFTDNFVPWLTRLGFQHVASPVDDWHEIYIFPTATPETARTVLMNVWKLHRGGKEDMRRSFG